ncbi:oxepin-CoA hydrolase, alternative type [Thalassovita sp.]|uniref:oxepin-CoA hydrolase, alternative type n=1 Tax=Thalassovita sp. TaxID=1979401 RepID=UPI0029DE7729|nr:enoyl-CoA hydratase family protein [Thalassovita sp.]
MTGNDMNVTVLDVETPEDGIRVLTLNGPKTRNSVGRSQCEDLHAAIIEAGNDSRVRAIILQGAGNFFCSGGNVNALLEGRSRTLAQVSRNTDAMAAMILAIRACPTPVIAAVEGGAAGVGMSLVLSCDMIVASDRAKFTAAYVKIGLSPDGGATHFLLDALPRQFVSEMCMLGRPVSVDRFHHAGVINLLCAEGEAFAAALDLARSLARGPAGAIAVIKSEINDARRNDLATQIDLEARNINKARYGAEAAEGIQAFIDKRPPDFVSLD